ncbi:ROK family transcriptional regulator [Streptomyces sp. NPDC014864]|uniref:ROK family transcriptional regulator n=1 Tax=Streptomyces sp. NPDC014864 TaxID=3364924 RepID=UPI0037014213
MPASPSTARAINDRLALRLMQREGPLTAGQLKQLTGLSRPTVADLVERLTASGLVTVVGESGAQRRGPNARLYGIVADRAHLAALDVRTESVSVTVSDLLGRVLAEASVPIGGDTGTGAAVQRAVALVERTAAEAGVAGVPPGEGPGRGSLHTVGIGAPGLIDPVSGELRDSTGLPEWHRRLVAALQERLPRARVIVENETNLAAVAEQREGAARDRDTFVLLWLGHGTGAAVVLDGALRRGASGGTGEIGFLPVPGTAALPSATDCAGGFHSLAGSAAVVELAARFGLVAEPGPAQPGRRRKSGLTEPRALGPVGTEPGPLGPVGTEPGALGPGRAESALTEPGVTVPGQTEPEPAESRRTGESGLDRAGGGPVAVTGAGGDGAEAVSPARARTGAEGGAASGVGPEPVAAEVVRGAVAAVASDPGDLDPAARADRFLDALADRLAVGAASVVALLDPGCVVLGGEVGQAGGEVLAARVAQRLRRMSPLPTEVRPAVLGGGAVLRGALLTARDHAQDELFTPPDR